MSSVDPFSFDSAVLAFDVLGVPAPQGSKSAVYAGGRARVIEGSSTTGRARHKAWRLAVAETAREVWAGRPPLDEPVAVHATFWLPRPSSRKAAVWADRRPDLDKLCRSLLDSVAEAGVISDDSRVVKIVCSKMLSTSWTGATVALFVEK